VPASSRFWWEEDEEPINDAIRKAYGFGSTRNGKAGPIKIKRFEV
jgi:hypothetical protein